MHKTRPKPKVVLSTKDDKVFVDIKYGTDAEADAAIGEIKKQLLKKGINLETLVMCDSRTEFDQRESGMKRMECCMGDESKCMCREFDLYK